MKQTTILCFLLLNSFMAFCQVFQVQGRNVLAYLPDTGKSYPAFVFVTGLGETGTDTNAAKVNGPHQYIKQGWRPPFAVFTIQPKSGEWMAAATTDAMLAGIRAKYPQITGIALSGLSAGGYATQQYIFQDASYAKKLLAAIPMSIQGPDKPYSYTNAGSLPVWAMDGTGDPFFDGMKALYTSLGDRFSSFYSTGHNNWNLVYNPIYRDPVYGQSIYDFAFKHAVYNGATPVAPVDTTATPPVVTKKLLLTIKVYSDGTTETVPGQ